MVVIEAIAKDTDDIGMVQRCEGLEFTGERQAELRLLAGIGGLARGKGRRDQLQGDLSSREEVGGPVDGPHTPFAQLLVKAIAAINRHLCQRGHDNSHEETTFPRPLNRRFQAGVAVKWPWAPARKRGH